MQTQYLDILQNVPLFKNISDDDLKILLDQTEELTVDPDTLIIKQGDQGDFLMIIISGDVLVYLDIEEHADSIINLSTLGKGDYFGEMALITGEPRSANVKAKTNCKLLKIDKNVFDQLIIQNPAISLSLTHILSQRLKQSNLKRAETQTVMESKIKPTGDLKEYDFAQLLTFCEKNSVTGLLKLKNKSERAVLTFEKGILQNIDYGDYSEDEALDSILKWEDGQFEIEPRQLEIKLKSTETTDDNAIIIANFSSNLFRKLIQMVGVKKLSEIINKSKTELDEYFPVLKKFETNINKEISVNLKKLEKCGDKEILSIGVYLQTIIENCKPFVVGISYLDLNKIAGKDETHLKNIMFFEYMNHSQEFIRISYS